MQNLKQIDNPINTFNVCLPNQFKLHILVLFCFIKAKEYLVQKQAHFFPSTSYLIDSNFFLLH